MEHIFFYDKNNYYNKLYFHRTMYLEEIKKMNPDYQFLTYKHYSSSFPSHQKKNEKNSDSERILEYICDFCNKSKHIRESNIQNKSHEEEHVLYMLNTPKEYNIICFSCGEKIIENEKSNIIVLKKLSLFID